MYFIHSFIHFVYGNSEKRIKFEQLILYEKRRMDGFRVKETRDVLTLDELKERVETVDELFDIIEVGTIHSLPLQCHLFHYSCSSCNLECFCLFFLFSVFVSNCFIMIYMTVFMPFIWLYTFHSRI